MKLAFLLHIYQPPIQEFKVLKEIADTSYVPLIKSIKNRSDIRLTLNVPLSLAYQLHAQKYDQLLNRIKDLYDEERIELTTSGAYHPLFTRLPTEVLEAELILNEYGIGYYFGKNKGFEGEDAIMLKNVTGVFPPEMAVNQSVIEYLDGLGYSWVAVDEVSLSDDYLNNKDKNIVFSYDHLNIKVICRNTKLSNILSFKRDTNINDFIDEVLRLRQDGQDAFVALDGEFFGYHYNEGLFLFESLTSKLLELGVELVTVSELVDASSNTKIESIFESTWGTNKLLLSEGIIYPMWQINGNKIQDLLWKIYNRILETDAIISLGGVTSDKAGVVLETFPIWDLHELEKINDVHLKNKIYKLLLYLQSLNSDQFWWASRAVVGGKEMYSKNILNSVLALYEKYGLVSEDKDLQKFIADHSNQIRSLL